MRCELGSRYKTARGLGRSVRHRRPGVGRDSRNRLGAGRRHADEGAGGTRRSMERMFSWRERRRRRERTELRQRRRSGNLPCSGRRGDRRRKRQRRCERRRHPGGAQAGCNFQSGTLVYGLEGDFDYFHTNPQFNNNTNTLANGNAFAISQSLTTNFLATVRPRIGIAADRNLASPVARPSPA